MFLRIFILNLFLLFSFLSVAAEVSDPKLKSADEDGHGLSCCKEISDKDRYSEPNPVQYVDGILGTSEGKERKDSKATK